jgi:hypothetical protein
MAQRSPLARRRALIVEDEPMIALSLEADMREMDRARKIGGEHA